MKQAEHNINCALVFNHAIKHGSCPFPLPVETDSKARFDDKVADWGYLDFGKLTDHKLGDLFCRAVNNHDNGSPVDAFNLWALAEYLDWLRFND